MSTAKALPGAAELASWHSGGKAGKPRRLRRRVRGGEG